ncbi:helix-turn-helix domain-containing protein [Luteimicrobium album]|uniref:helix-turn-helix domain-containing protein n=1 Tax=Luteimicrobium album TaxID=1054550 RepID=UPI0024E0BCCF|nr:helix-turn-helix domain-containing protein [Luteimicrobium album]
MVPGAVLWWSRSGPETPEKRVLPDGCVDLLWTGTHLKVAGPDVVAFTTGSPAGSLVAGLRFAPGTGPRTLGLRAHEAVGQRVPLDALLAGSRVARWEAQVSAAEHVRQAPGGPPGLVVGLEAVARALVDAAPPADDLVLAMVAAVRRGLGVGETARELDVSERTLHRRALPALGYGPATLGRVLRLQRAVGLARRGVPWADVAARSGFADQAHLARDVRALAGVSPTTLVPAPRTAQGWEPGSQANRSTGLPSGSRTVA